MVAEYSHGSQMESWDRPPPDVTGAELFERWLPGAFAASGYRAPADAPVVRVSISGTDGGSWELHADAGTLSVAPAGREPPDVWIRQSIADLRVSLGGSDPDLPALLPPGVAAEAQPPRPSRQAAALRRSRRI